MLSALAHAWQSWKSARAVAALAAVAFAVGIGSATAIYTVVNGVMLRPLPYPDDHRFVALYGARFSEPRQRSSHTFPDLLEYQQRTQSFDVFGWFRPGSFNMTFAGQPQHVVGAEVTPSLVRNLGVNPIVGQWFLDDQSAVILGLLLGQKSSGEQYGSAEKHLLRQCAEQLTLMIENARLTHRVVEQEKLRRDLALAAEVQKRLLPGQPPEFSGGVLAALSLPARSVGGDYYDFLDLGDQRIGIALADIAGKGIAAALIMAVVQASLRIVAAEGETSLPDLAAKMNGFLHRSTGSNSYATFFYAQLDEHSRKLRYVNAGHNPPYLLRPVDGQPRGTSESLPEIRELSIWGHGAWPLSTDELRRGDRRSAIRRTCSSRSPMASPKH